MLVRRYLAFAGACYLWLPVRTDEGERAAANAVAARACATTLASYRRRLTVEELIPSGRPQVRPPGP